MNPVVGSPAADRERLRSATATRAAAAALVFKTDVLWAQLDALWHGYVEGNIPPGAWRPGEGLLAPSRELAGAG